jgi:hypothetical protein
VPRWVLFVLALAVPFLRNFYELSTPTGKAVAAWAAGTALGIVGMLGGPTPAARVVTAAVPPSAVRARASPRATSARRGDR